MFSQITTLWPEPVHLLAPLLAPIWLLFSCCTFSGTFTSSHLAAFLILYIMMNFCIFLYFCILKLFSCFLFCVTLNFCIFQHVCLLPSGCFPHRLENPSSLNVVALAINGRTALSEFHHDFFPSSILQFQHLGFCIYSLSASKVGSWIR